MSNQADITTNKLTCLEEEFNRAGRSTYLRIDLDIIVNNVEILKSLCSKRTEVMAMVKANAYGHGSGEISKHLEEHGIRHFAVATVGEGVELRRSGVTGFIQIMGNAVQEEISHLKQYSLTPTACTAGFVRAWSDFDIQLGKENNICRNARKVSQIGLKLDTGLSRFGCQEEDLYELLELCDKLHIPVHSVMTHFAKAWDDREFTQHQLDRFLQVTQNLRERGIKLHVAKSAGVIRGQGENLDFVRPGICMYGLSPDSRQESIEIVKALGMRPALSWIAHPSLLKELEPGRYVGYDKSYRCSTKEVIATFGLGYGDGLPRVLSNRGHLTSEKGEQFPFVGRVSMDAITVKLNKILPESHPFYVIKNDFMSCNSVARISRDIGTIPYVVCAGLNRRLPRVFVSEGKIKSVVNQFGPG